MGTCAATTNPTLNACLLNNPGELRSRCVDDQDCGTAVCSHGPIDGVCLAPNTLSGPGGACSVEMVPPVVAPDGAQGPAITNVVACAPGLFCDNTGLCQPEGEPGTYEECAGVSNQCTPGSGGDGFCADIGRGGGSGACVPQPTNREGALCGPPGGGCEAGLLCSTSPVFRLCFDPVDVGGVGAPCGVTVVGGVVSIDPCAPDLICDDPSFTCQAIDADGDGLDLATERRLGTNPDDADSDDDGLCDGPRPGVGCVPGEDQNANGIREPGETDATRPDTDCDGVLDGGEAMAGTSALVADSDSDGILDGVERGQPGGGAPGCGVIAGDADPLTTTNPNDPDSDGDGFCDGPTTIPMVCVAGEDTNANGAIDGAESDPNNPGSTP